MNPEKSTAIYFSKGKSETVRPLKLFDRPIPWVTEILRELDNSITCTIADSSSNQANTTGPSLTLYRRAGRRRPQRAAVGKGYQNHRPSTSDSYFQIPNTRTARAAPTAHSDDLTEIRLFEVPLSSHAV
ncbi:hypothetical protein EVAR_75818_1 [Eumeta japonica]|uniref:Uncharacterized protein n=1 Tax=Eumeta variegata TaxID=151549 RepID=A0A4C1TD26_EUMVA|nr:hypothetical protein EVAR_75818_1 [Eumeta japonica]